MFNGCVDRKKKIPQNVHFRFGRVHVDKSLEKLGISQKLQLLLLKQEMKYDEIYENTWEDKDVEWLPILKTTFCRLFFLLC